MAHYKQIQTKKGLRWIVHVYAGNDANGKAIQLSKTCVTKGLAQKWARETLTKRDTGELVAGKATVSLLLDDLLLDYKTNRRSEWGEIMVKAHLRPFFGAMRVDKVTTQTLQRYVVQRQSLGRASGTIQGELAVLKRAFHLGQRSTPPKVGRIPHFPQMPEGTPRQGFFEHPEYAAMMEALPEELRPVLCFGFHTGTRRAEVVGLQWAQVDLLGRVARLNPGETKNKEGRVIPLSRDVLALLTIQRALRDQYHPRCPWVFFRHATGERLRDFRGSWETACKACGLWDDSAGKLDKKTGKPTGKATRLFHDLRRTGVRNLVRSGVPERVAMSISGHKTRAVFDRYNIVSEADLMVAVDRLDGYLDERRAQENETLRKVCEIQNAQDSGTPENPSNLVN